MNNLTIFWHHVGREHGFGAYGLDLRKNSDKLIRQYLDFKIQRIKSGVIERRFIQIDEPTLVELAAQDAPEELFIGYRIQEGLQYSLNVKKSWTGWLIDVVDIYAIEPNLYCSRDLFLDVRVKPSGDYELIDVDEFRQAIELGIIDQATTIKALRSLEFALAQLRAKQFPPVWLRELVALHAPTLLNITDH